MENTIYQTYSSNQGMTFILEDIYRDGVLVSTEVKGFYFGEPDDQAKLQFFGKLKAEF
jgi:hypothetical protein